MNTISNLQKIILSAVIQKPQTGYEVTNDFLASHALHWNATQQQVYRELKRMHQSGLLGCTEVSGIARPDRKVYNTTPAGEQAYIDLQTQAPSACTGLNTQDTIHTLFANADYFQQLLDKRTEESEALYMQLCGEEVPSPLETVLLNRRILLLNAERTFAEQMLQMIASKQSEEKVVS